MLAHPRKPARLLAAFPLLALVAGGCSHTSPYYGPGPTETAEATRATAPPPASEIRSRLVLLGDAGAPDPGGEPTLRALTDTAANLADRTLVAFLGDNAYEKGIPPLEHPDRPEAERRLRAQVDAVLESGARGLFTPGNHDWAEGDEGGYGNLMRMQELVDEAGGDRIRWLPRDGCPGPAAYAELEGVRVVVLDTQWWFYDDVLPRESCAPADTGSALAELPAMLEPAGDGEVVVIGHHFLLSEGLHGGFATWKEHLFPLTMLKDWAWLPLPGLGSLYHLYAQRWGRTQQDLASGTYQAFIVRMTEALAPNPPLIHAAGHEHNLQVLAGHPAAEFLLISGAGSASKVSPVGDGRRSLFAHAHVGFMVVDFFHDGRVLLRVVEPAAAAEYRVVLAWWLRQR